MRPRNLIIAVLAAVSLAGCKTVVTTTTEIRPSRYAALEFTRPVSHDRIVQYAQQALRAENIKIQSVDSDAGTVSGGPVKFAGTADAPELDATVTITTNTTGANTTVRIYTSSAIKQNEVGGQDPRLMELAQRIEKRLDTLIGH